MAKNNLAHIEEVFHAAMSCDPEERRAYLGRACAGDAVMLREVESLVAASDSSSGLLDETGVTLAMKVMGARPDDSMAGQTVGFYTILSWLGQGGMGTVYLAEDTRLNRKVALKFLSSDFISDSWAKRQLIKEAQAVAMLDHPNICPVYGFEEIDGHSFIVMQYIEGETLADLIEAGTLDISQVIALAQQIVSALGNAHAHGIIHRDIKPKNIMVTPARQVKVLDFGLAKTAPKTVEDSTESISNLSRDGLLIGTVAYMSPEQLCNERIDYRSDIFSLGTLLYEMTAGLNPHADKNNAKVISAIISRQPQRLRKVSVNCPRALEQIVNRCLQKDRADRYQSAAELLIDLENAQRGKLLTAPINRYVNVRYATLAALALLVIVVATFIYRAWRRPEHTLAVMSIPCEDGIDPDQCSAITKGLQRTMSRRPGLLVASSSNFAGIFGPNAATPEKAARDLDADLIMFGKVGQGETKPVLTIIVQRVSDGERLIERPYPLNGGNPSLLGQRVALEATFQLQLPTDEDDKTLLDLLAANDNHSPQAYSFYLKGRKEWSLRDHDNLKAAIDDFLKATELDPAYAEAYAGLADCYVLLSTPANGSFATPTADAMVKAKWAAKEALKYGENLAEAHSAYAAVLWKGDWDWEGAEKEFKKAIALAPDYEPAHLNYSIVLSHIGRTQEALKESELAMTKDPTSGAAVMNYCRTQYQARQFDQADACLNKLALERPNYSGGKYLHGIVYNALGRIPEATQIFEEIYARDKAYGGALLGYTYGIAGRRADAERVLNEMRQLQKERYLADQELAVIYMGMGDLDNAFPLFQKALEDGFPPSQALFFSPSFDRLRADPRFPDLLKHAKQPVIALAGGSSSSASLR